jgi:pyridoxine 4-dehydrogenase
MLSGDITKPEDIPEGDIRRMMPRFSKENFHHNLELVLEIQKLAKQKECTPAQLAINWVLHLSKRDENPEIIPIPGTTKEERVHENGKVITLSTDDIADIDSILNRFEVKGDRSDGPGKAFIEG